VQLLSPMQERRKKFEENPRLAWIFWRLAVNGHGKVAAATMDGVREAMGMSLAYEPPAAEDGK